MKTKFPSLYGQMAYVIGSGLSLLFVPNILLGIFGFAPTQEIWIRVMGLLVVVLAFYYRAIARSNAAEVALATVYGRLVFCAGLVCFVFLGMAQTPLIGFALAETALALWTWQELKRG
jgi:hypothetical protein